MGDTIDEKELQKIAEFFLKYSGYLVDIEIAKSYILKHYEFKTAFVGHDDEGEIIFVCRWNINGDTAEILDLYIREDYRGKKIIQQLLKQGIWVFPEVKRIKFERQKKYPGREFHTISVEKILKERK